MGAIRKSVLASIESVNPMDDFEVPFSIDWDIIGFMCSQYGEMVPIGSIVTITGSALCTQATTCDDYVRSNWPVTGPFLLEVLQDAL